MRFVSRTGLCSAPLFLAPAMVEHWRPTSLTARVSLPNAILDLLTNAFVPQLHSHHEGDARRGADRVAPTDASRRFGAADLGWHLCMVAVGLPCAAQHRAHRPRRAER